MSKPLIQLPCGTWVDPRDAKQIKALPRTDHFVGGGSSPPRVLVNGEHACECSSFDEAAALRDALAADVARALASRDPLPPLLAINPSASVDPLRVESVDMNWFSGEIYVCVRMQNGQKYSRGFEYGKDDEAAAFHASLTAAIDAARASRGIDE